MLEILDMPIEVVKGLRIELTRKLQQPRRSRIKDEVLVRSLHEIVRRNVTSNCYYLSCMTAHGSDHSKHFKVAVGLAWPGHGHPASYFL